MICPCKTCDRKGCGSFHDSCEAYQEWSAWNEEKNRKKAAEKEANGLSRDHEMKYRRNIKTGVYK